MYSKKPGFSFVELVVSVCVLAILSSVSFMAFSSYMKSSRDSQRITDLSALSLSLKSHIQRFGLLPQPNNSFAIKNGTIAVANQGLLNENTGIFGLSTVPKDPQLDRGYSFSVAANRKEYQLGATLENNRTPSAKVVGNYRVVAKDIAPSLLLAAAGTTAFDISQADAQSRFVLEGSETSLLYSFVDGLPVYNATQSLTSLILNASGTLQTSSIYSSCSEIGADNKAIGTGNYLIIDNAGSLVSVSCCLAGASLVSC